MKCMKRFTTYERVCVIELFVIKRDGRKEVFDREKLKLGLAKALEKRPGIEHLDSLVTNIEKKLKIREKSEIEAKVIGQTALGELKKLDMVAYLRFASVYRQFKNPADFAKALEHLKID